MSGKKIFKITWISAAILLGAVLVFALVLWLTVDADMIESALEKQLSRKVKIGGIKAGLFAAVSGISAERISISDRWSIERLEAQDDIAEEDVFMRLASLEFQFEFLPLLRRHLRVRALILEGPEIRLVRYPDGSLNVSDLMSPGTPGKEMEAGDLPLSLHIERIRVSDGTLLFEDRMTGSRYRIRDLSMEIFDIRVDPADLQHHNSLMLRIESVLESVFIQPGGFAQEVVAEFRMRGQIRPFDPLSGKTSPQAKMEIETPSGQIKGSALFARLRSVPLLKNFGVTPDFLPEDMNWDRGSIVLSYADDVIQLDNGTFHLEGYGLNYSGSFHLETEAVNADLELLLDPGLNEPVRSMIGRQADSILRSDMKKYVSGDDVARALVTAMQNEDKQIHLPFRVSGTLSRPKAALKAPAAAALSEAVQTLIAERAKSAGEKAVKDKLTDTLKGLIKKKK